MLLKTSVWYLLPARLHGLKYKKNNKKEQKLTRKERRMVYMWPSEFIK